MRRSLLAVGFTSVSILSGLQYLLVFSSSRFCGDPIRWWDHATNTFLVSGDSSSFGVPKTVSSIPFTNKAQRPSAAARRGPLNVVVLYPDDWKHDSLEDVQPGLIHTPFLSQLAREGIRFTHNAVTSSVCWLSRATLFTGRYASQHKSMRPICPIFTDHKWWKHTWPYRLMKDGGYWYGHVGKWQYRNDQQFLQNAFNFSRFHEGEHWMNIRDKETNEVLKRVHAAKMAKDDAIEFLRERPKDRPFAMTVAFYPPKPVGRDTSPGAAWSPEESFYDLYRDHEFVEPYNFSEAFESLPPFLKAGIGRDRFAWRYSTHHHYQEGMKRYHALISQVDHASQQIIDELKQQGVYDNTLIIFTTDNGLMQGAHGLAGKWHPYEESIRVPLIIRDPRLSTDKRGTLDDSFTLNIDLATTILGAAGIQPSSNMQGRDISELYLLPPHNRPSSDARRREVKEEEEEEPVSFSSTSTSTSSWREDFFYELPLKQFPASTALVTKEWKYVQWPTTTKTGGAGGGNYEQLFHLPSDPYELRDLLFHHNSQHQHHHQQNHHQQNHHQQNHHHGGGDEEEEGGGGGGSTNNETTTTTIRNTTRTTTTTTISSKHKVIFTLLQKRHAQLQEAATTTTTMTNGKKKKKKLTKKQKQLLECKRRLYDGS